MTGPVVVLTHHPRPTLEMEGGTTFHFVDVPIVLSRGERLWGGLEGLDERVSIEANSSPSGVVHLSNSGRPARQ